LILETTREKNWQKFEWLVYANCAVWRILMLLVAGCPTIPTSRNLTAKNGNRNLSGQFHQRFRSSFCTRRSHRCKKTLMTWLSFCRFGICKCKSSSNISVGEIDPWLMFIGKTRKNSNLARPFWYKLQNVD